MASKPIVPEWEAQGKKLENIIDETNLSRQQFCNEINNFILLCNDEDHIEAIGADEGT